MCFLPRAFRADALEEDVDTVAAKILRHIEARHLAGDVEYSTALAAHEMRVRRFLTRIIAGAFCRYVDIVGKPLLCEEPQAAEYRGAGEHRIPLFKSRIDCLSSGMQGA